MIVRAIVFSLLLVVDLSLSGWPNAQASSSPDAPPAESLFAIVITTGPAWEASRPPNEQPHFAEHSAHMRRLRERGDIRIGARYADRGLLVVRAASAEAAHRLMDDDPSIAAGTFVFEVHPFMVFYPGSVEAGPRP